MSIETYEVEPFTSTEDQRVPQLDQIGMVVYAKHGRAADAYAMCAADATVLAKRIFEMAGGNTRILGVDESPKVVGGQVGSYVDAITERRVRIHVDQSVRPGTVEARIEAVAA